MKLEFCKYQGAGNDFIMIDNRSLFFPKINSDLIAGLCDRKFGIGADGLILVEPSEKYDFTMVYYNADGKPGTMCGNGGRCTVAYANRLGIIDDTAVFDAVDGLHEAFIKAERVHLKMADVSTVQEFKDHLFVNTGSPHHITFVDTVSNTDVYNLGRSIRYGAPYFDEGANVNFVEQEGPATFKVRTYERGVENETLSCGTGVTAVALASHKIKKTSANKLTLNTLGGSLEVSFEPDNNTYKNVFLIGEATFVFKGEISV